MKKAIVKCSSYGGGFYYGVFNITEQKELENLELIATEIKKNEEIWNWTTESKVVKEGDDWVDQKEIYSFYPDIPKEVIDWFSSQIPSDVDSIEEINIIDYEREANLI